MLVISIAIANFVNMHTFRWICVLFKMNHFSAKYTRYHIIIIELSSGVLTWYWVSSDIHDDVIKWKHFPRYWPFGREIHRSPVNSPHKGQWRGVLMFSLMCLNERLSKQSRGWWFEKLSSHYDVTVMTTDFYRRTTDFTVIFRITSFLLNDNDDV